MKTASVLVALVLMVPFGVLLASDDASASTVPTENTAISETYYSYLPWYPSGGVVESNLHGEPISIMVGIDWGGGPEGTVMVNVTECDLPELGGLCLPPVHFRMEKVGGLYKAVINATGRNDYLYGKELHFSYYANNGAGLILVGPETSFEISPPVGRVYLNGTVSSASVFPGERIWFNGTTQYNNSGRFGYQGIAQTSPLSISGPFSWNGKTTLDGDYHVNVSAPVSFGRHRVDVTVSNATVEVADTESFNITILPRSPLTASFSTLTIEPSHLFPGERFWLNGTARYNNSQPMAMSPVSVASDVLTVNGKTDAQGGFSFSAIMPVDYGAHTVTVNVTNSSFATWLSDPAHNVWLEDTVSVTADPITASFQSVSVSPQTCYPNNAVTVSGDATYNTGVPAAHSLVNITLKDGATVTMSTTALTDSSGHFSKAISAPTGLANHTVLIDIWNATYLTAGHAQSWLNVTPVPAGADKLEVAPASNLMDTDEHLAVAIRALFDSDLQADVNWTVDLSTSSTGHFSATPTGAAIASVSLVNGSASVYYSDTVAWTNATLTADYAHPTEPKTASAVVTVRPIDTIPPVVVANVNSTGGFLPLAVRFDGSATTDNRGVLASTEWSITRGATLIAGSGFTVLDFTFTVEGDYLAVFTATDARGNSANFSAHVVVERDTDGDTYADPDDAFPTDPLEWVDSDGDTHGDNSDVFPANATEWDDTDLDGYGDNFDAFPLDESQWSDSDGDGYGDNATGDMPDAFPQDSGEWNDTDEDGVGDNADAFPSDETEWLDTDGDTHGDNSDAFPTNATEWADTDDDGFGDNVDKFDLDPAATYDSDGDGHPDCWNEGKTAADSTTVPPLTLDFFPEDPAQWREPEEESNLGTIIIVAIIVVVVLAGVGAAAFLAFGKGK